MKINKKGKKRLGFTLIELLAVIVILAVIALITIYIIGDVIEQAKIKKYYSEEKSMETAAGLYLVKNEGMLDRVIDSQVITLRTLVNSEVMKAVHDSGNGGLCDQEQSKVLVNVDKEKRLVSYTGCLKCSNYQTKNADCGFVEEVEDKKLCELEEKNGTYYIDSEEDLYALSISVNSGNNYSGKTVKLRKNLDMSKSLTTIKNSCGEDMVSFEPIGNNKTSSNRFDGIFEGDGYYIKNLTLNKPDDDYVGLFGYLTGTVKGINIENINITGKNRVGGLAGQVQGTNTKPATVSDIKISGSVSGNSYIGGIIGYLAASNSLNNFISNMNVAGTSNVSGVEGGGSSTISNGVIEGGSITLSSNSNYYVSPYSYSGCKNVYVSSATTLNGKNKPIGEYNCKGRGYPSEYFGRLNGYEEVLDTYIGGDNDGDGYYFDFDNNKNIVVKSTSRNPIPKISSLTKKDGVYQISSIDDWNIAVVYPKENYELTSDLDFGNDQTYMLGGKYDKDNEDNNNAFAGTFEGNGYKIKNYKILGMNNAGLFGYLSGDILGINIENAYVDGYNNVGGLVGNLAGTNAKPATVSDIKITGSVTGNDYVGGITGYTSAYGSVTNFISNMNVTATANGSGISGNGTSTITNGIIEGGTIVSSSNSSLFVSQYNSTGCTGVYVSSATTLNGKNKPIGEYNCKGRGYPSEYFGRLNGYEEVIDTYIGGDNDGDDYYFDYDNNKNIIVKSTSRNPFPKLSSLTKKNDVYQISSIDDWNIAVVYPKGKNYELTSDLDFNNKEIYMLGSVSNEFSGTFEGNNHKIKNYKVQGINYAGLFGYNSGVIQKLDVSGLNVDGYNNVGGLVGKIAGTKDNPAQVTKLKITGNVTGHDSVGGIVGYLAYGDIGSVSEFTLNMNVSGNSDVGAAGGNGSSFSGSITGGSITGHGTTRFVSAYVCAGSDLSCKCSDVEVAPSVTLNQYRTDVSGNVTINTILRSDLREYDSECNGHCASCQKNH